MISLEPEVSLIAQTGINFDAMADFVNAQGGQEWVERMVDEFREQSPETLVEFMGRLCYRSWAPNLNPNVTKVRKDSELYLGNIVSSGHGSVLEHVSFSFIFHNVSRVFTHELVRHRVGTAFSQESMRYVRHDQIPFKMPEYVLSDDVLLAAATKLLEDTEAFLMLSAQRTGITDKDKNFHFKKEITSDIRRFLPEGVLTTIGFTCNLRELRHLIALRTSDAAEKELRLVITQVGDIIFDKAPALMADFVKDENGTWTPGFRC